MPRIQGVDIPPDKPTHISLRYIRGLGPTTSLEVCEKLNIDPQRRAKELNDDEIARIATLLDRDYLVEGRCGGSRRRTSTGSRKSRATAASGTARTCPPAASGPRPTPGPARGRA